MLGKHHTESSKQKLRQARLKYKVTEETKKKQSLGGNPYATKVLQFNKDGTFVKKWECVKEAAESIKCASHGNICVCCQKNANLTKAYSSCGSCFYTAYGYVWKYENNIQYRKKSGNKKISQLKNRNTKTL